MEVSIVIVNWNTGLLLGECLHSIPAAAAALAPEHRLGKVVIVDNASDDGSEQTPAPPDLPVHWIRNADNRGFGAACNQGAATIDSDALLFLNPDTRLFPDSLARPLHLLCTTGRERVGVVGIALVDHTGQITASCARTPRAHHYLAQALGIDVMWPQAGLFMREWDHSETREVDQVIGAFFFVRRALFQSLGGFDERFFVYFEEVDFALRARQAGWSSLYLATARAYHKGGGSTDAVRAKRLFYSLRSRLQFAAKHLGRTERALLQTVTWTLEPAARALMLVARGRLMELSQLHQAYRWLRSDRSTRAGNR